MSDAKIWIGTIILFVFVFIKFTIFSPIWLILATSRHISLHGLDGLGRHFEIVFSALGQMWRKYVFFWLDEDQMEGKCHQ